ncbi:MAG: molybdopterin-dependent oxidoreductase [Desulfohalobiaceae bacterium]
MRKDTVCRLCSACCPVQVEVQDGRLLSARRKSSAPASQKLNCHKLSAAAQIVYSQDRITSPLIKDEQRNFRRASWDEALDLVASRMLQTRQDFGAHQTAWLRGMAADWGAPWDYAKRLMHAFGSPNCIGNGSVCHVAREMAHTYTYGAMTLPQPGAARCIVIWGKNDSNTAPGMFEAILKARQAGARLIVIDPVQTRPAEMADVWLQIKPGQDGILAMSMAQEILKQDLWDADFVQDFCLGFEDFRQAAQAYAPEQIAESIWLDAQQIKEAARMYAQNRPACIIDGNGLDMQLDTFQITRAVCILRALTGNLDRQGGDLIPQPVPVRDIQLQDRLPAQPEPVTRDYPLFSTFHPNWGLHAQSCLIDSILQQHPYPVRSLVIQSGNPAYSMADSKRVRQALGQLDFIAVIDLFMTQTAEMADVFLPASSCFEKTQLNRAYLRNNQVVLQDQVLDWLGQSWPDWKIVFELGRRLGLEQEFPWSSAEEAIDYQLQPAGITVQMLREHPEGVWAQKQAYTKYRMQGFATPSGKVELYSRRLAEQGQSGVPYQDFVQAAAISFSGHWPDLDLVGISGQRDNHFTHTQFHHIPALTRQQSQGYINIHPDDAWARGITDQDMTLVQTPSGEVRMPARLSTRIQPGSICIDWGWAEVQPEANVNNLTDDSKRDPVTCTPANRTFMCKVRKADE